MELTSPGQVIDIHPMGSGIKTDQKFLLVKTRDVELVQFVVPAGKDIPEYQAQGQVILDCQEGRICVTALGADHNLRAGQLLYLLSVTEITISARQIST